MKNLIQMILQVQQIHRHLLNKKENHILVLYKTNQEETFPFRDSS